MLIGVLSCSVWGKNSRKSVSAANGLLALQKNGPLCSCVWLESCVWIMTCSGPEHWFFYSLLNNLVAQYVSCMLHWKNIIFWTLKLIMHHRLSVLAYHFKTAVDCFFAVWFVVGNVWIFGGRSISSDAQDAPNMYRYLHCCLFLS